MCDEYVTRSYSDEQKKAYANLLLRTVGEERGFTANLSAGAESLKYRMQNVLNPEKKKNGILAISLIIFVMFAAFRPIVFAEGYVPWKRKSIKILTSAALYMANICVR